MSIDFHHDYSDHTLLDNKRKYREIYKLSPAEAADLHKGDLVLLKTFCGCFGVYFVTADSDEDNTIHVTKYAEIDFAKLDGDSNSGGSIVENETNPCIC